MDTVQSTLEQTPPELAADVAEEGIVLAGGGSLLKGLDVLLADETHLPVRIAESPLTCVAIGAGRGSATFRTRGLQAGRHRVVLRAQDSARNRSRRVSRRFRVLP